MTMRVPMLLLCLLLTSLVLPPALASCSILSVSVSDHVLNATISIPRNLPTVTVVLAIYRNESGVLELYDIHLFKASGGTNITLSMPIESGSFVIRAMVWSSLLIESMNRTWYTFYSETQSVEVIE